jgi:tRNA A37 threonylcarbamoyladenosine modification protein TsaB
MIIFLDTVSSLPEFSLIKDNKIIYSCNILSNQTEKMSDLLIPSYVYLEKKFNLNSELELLLINTGPGSYTALRVGIAFFSGLSLAKNINLIGVSCIDLFRFVIPDKELITSGIYISSSNNQNFIYFFDLKENKFKIKKIETNISLCKQNINFNIFTKIYLNENLNEQNKNLFSGMKVEVIKFSKLINNNLDKIKNFKKNQIIEPIYCSNNKILN